MEVTASKKYRALHPYTGSKQKAEIRNWLLRHFPAPGTYTTYVEPFAGAASMLLALPRAKREVLVEKCLDQYTLLRVIRDHAFVLGMRFADLGVREEGERRLFDLALRRQKSGEDLFDDQIDRAKYQLIRNCLSRDSKGTTFKPRHFGEKRIRPTLEEYVERAVDAADRLEGVEIHHGDGINRAMAFIKNKSAFVFFDPPYLHETRVSKKLYNHEMGEEEHLRLLKLAVSMKGRVAISGYPSDLYDDHLKGWRRVTLEVHGVKRTKTEVLWCNY